MSDEELHLVDPEDHAALESGRLLFAAECDFVRGVTKLDALPPDDRPEVAFIGRSNVGKSSLINALTGRNKLARTSNTPGRTQELNFFALGPDAMYLVDLPGYGYAKRSKSLIAGWTKLMKAYLRGRPNLRRVCLLIDGRHGLKDSDIEFMSMLDEAGVAYQIVLTKADKVKKAEMSKRIQQTSARILKHAAAFPTPWPVSALKGRGIPELRAAITQIARDEGRWG
ncbi:MAG: ribosome biogenesis GTP-binding protein YihA/YsxC [Alphaproteobacteria bacterium]